MRRFHIRSIVLGIGMGIILTSIISMIYIEGIGLGKKLTEEEIIQEAEKLGMVKNTEIVINTTPIPTPKVEIQPTPISTPVPTAIPMVLPTQEPVITPTPNPVQVQGDFVVIKVYPGDLAVTVAGRLKEANLIADIDAFVVDMINSGASNKIIAREYRFQPGMTAEEIIQILTTNF